VLERQLADQMQTAGKPKPAGADGAAGGGASESARASGVPPQAASASATPAALGMLRRQLGAWRALACRRLLAAAAPGPGPGPGGGEGLAPLPAFPASKNIGGSYTLDKCGPRKEVQNIYRY
jgi:hypothetical protein